MSHRWRQTRNANPPSALSIDGAFASRAHRLVSAVDDLLDRGEYEDRAGCHGLNARQPRRLLRACALHLAVAYRTVDMDGANVFMRKLSEPGRLDEMGDGPMGKGN